jgi:serine/tyrosine/threonine adenylyltransferase
MGNPILGLNYESAFANLGDDYSDLVAAEVFPKAILRWRNDRVLQKLGGDAAQVSDEDWVAAWGRFEGREELRAMRYHGYQFGSYNPALGDGRGFLYGQVRSPDGKLYDLGTKGSGRTPYSRGGDGRLTLKGGVREVLAAEMLERMGVRTSQCLSVIETGEGLWRGDEPSPTRSAVMVRVQESHIRFGTFERLHYLGRRDLIATLLEHTVETYYPHLMGEGDRYGRFYGELVERVAALCAQWMAAGFCHAVLNTDNMAITGESFDYGPFAFIPTFDPKFTAAYFDHGGRYSYMNQPGICRLNLEMLQEPLKMVMEKRDLEAAIAPYDQHYAFHYRALMMQKLGFPADWDDAFAREFLRATLVFLNESQVGYHGFFAQLAQEFSPDWRSDVGQIFPNVEVLQTGGAEMMEKWRSLYHQALQAFPADAYEGIKQRLKRWNPQKVVLRPVIEELWAAIVERDDWGLFYQVIEEIRSVE